MEKFALLNLLKVLGSLNSQPAADSAENPTTATPQSATPSSPAEAATAMPANAYPNVMASVLERHEYISNRLRNKK